MLAISSKNKKNLLKKICKKVDSLTNRLWHKPQTDVVELKMNKHFITSYLIIQVANCASLFFLIAANLGYLSLHIFSKKKEYIISVLSLSCLAFDKEVKNI